MVSDKQADGHPGKAILGRMFEHVLVPPKVGYQKKMAAWAYVQELEARALAAAQPNGETFTREQMLAEVERRLDRALEAKRIVEAAQPKVKPLEWVKHPTSQIWRCDTLIGTYKIFGCRIAIWDFDSAADPKWRISKAAHSIDEAKAAAQVDYEARILSALDMSAEPVRPDWEAFGKSIMRNWPYGDVDGGEIQDLAEKFSIIVPCDGGFDPGKHFDVEGVGAEKGDPWYLLNYKKSTPPALKQEGE